MRENLEPRSTERGSAMRFLLPDYHPMMKICHGFIIKPLDLDGNRHVAFRPVLDNPYIENGDRLTRDDSRHFPKGIDIPLRTSNTLQNSPKLITDGREIETLLFFFRSPKNMGHLVCDVSWRSIQDLYCRVKIRYTYTDGNDTKF